MAATFSIKSQDGKVIGNLSVAEVKRLFDEGKIKQSDMISKDGSGKWHPASKYKTAVPLKKETETKEEEEKASFSSEKSQEQDKAAENNNN